MTRKTCCLHQVFRPVGPKVEIHGIGDCRNCIPDEHNSRCNLYAPIVITVDEFEED
jgi:hypothetical protein